MNKFIYLLILCFSMTVSGADVTPRYDGSIIDESGSVFVDILNDGTNDRFASDSIIKSRDPQGNLVELQESGVDDGNTTSTPLGIDAEFTGAWQNVVGYASISVTVKADQPSATEGLVIEFSPDQSTVIVDDRFSIKANVGEIYTVGVHAKFFRVRYINGSTAQTSFNLQTLMHRASPKPSNHKIDDPIDGENDAELVKAVQTGKDINGTFVNRPAGGVVDSNSTMTPLGSGATFTGEFINQTGYGGLSVFVNTDQDGTLFVDSSPDGVSFTTEQFSILSSTPFFTGFAPKTRFVRVRYTNGATAQTSFTLQSLLFTQQLSPSSQPIDTNLNNNSIAVNSRSILAGQREDGVFANVGLSNANSLEVAVTDRPSEVRGRTRVEIPITRTDITTGGTTLYTVTAGKTLYIHSFNFSALNDSTSIGQWRLRDDTTVKFGNILPQRTTGSPATNVSTSPSLPEPMQFNTNVNAIEVSGDIEISGFLIGYEE